MTGEKGTYNWIRELSKTIFCTICKKAIEIGHIGDRYGNTYKD
jgi:hypothetical protein